MINFFRNSSITPNRYKSFVNSINSLESNFALLSDTELKDYTKKLKSEVRKTNDFEQTIIKSFALVKEASWRSLGIKHFDTQLMGGLILNEGKIVEMKTGEGKTLVSTLPAFHNALFGKGVHIVTVNEYLAERDKKWMGQVHEKLGLTVGLIKEGMAPSFKKQGYDSDITYVTNSELAFDYLRENMAMKMDDLVQRPFNYAIIDEVDSILIDEARTPLIISEESSTDVKKYVQASEVANFLEIVKHFEVDEKGKNVSLTELGVSLCEQILNVLDLYDRDEAWAPYIINALKAKVLFITNKDYIVQSEEIIIVDEFTGRIMPDRRWSDGLHQAIESKENVPIRNNTQTLASITYQNFFLLYPKLSGMTGTAKTEEAELERIYDLQVLSLPTYKPLQRKDLPDSVYTSELSKWKAIANECRKMYSIGRPVLVGTTSVQKSEILSRLLQDSNIPHELLNAKPENAKRESEIIGQAGRRGSITIATNMAGRGTDIILGGNIPLIVKKDLLILLTTLKQSEIEPFFTKNKNFKDLSISEIKSLFLQIENQELDLIRIENFIDQISRGELMAETINSQFKIIQSIYNYFSQLYSLNILEECNLVKQLGGLYVIGTERHESRRIDNQLRGRSGRQGDPGTSKFFLSLDDNLLKIFGGNNIQNLMQTFALDDETPLESSFLTKSLNSAQTKVEQYYYDTRKQLFEYDAVLNSQRQAIFFERRNILETFNIKNWILSCGEVVIDEILKDLGTEILDLKNLENEFTLVFGVSLNLKLYNSQSKNFTNLNQFVYKQFWLMYESKELEFETYLPGLLRTVEKSIILSYIDNSWTEHLQKMTSLRESIRWRSYAQKDPLIEYKSEGYKLFVDMIKNIRRSVIYDILRSHIA